MSTKKRRNEPIKVQCRQCGTKQTVKRPISNKKCIFCGWKELVEA